MEWLLFVIVLLVLVGSVGGVAVARRRANRPPLEPPPRQGPPRAVPGEAAPTGPTRAPTGVIDAPERVRDGVTVPPELEAEIEDALRDAQVDADVEGPETTLEPEPEPEPEPELEPVPVEAPKRPRFRDRLSKARGLLSTYVGSVLSRTAIDDETWDELEEALIRADVGVTTTTALLTDLRARVKTEGIKTSEELIEALKADLKKRLAADERDLRFEAGAPNVWLFVGVNGVGKTTTIGKIGAREVRDGRTVIMAAGDTFRAAAAEQLGTWAERAGADFVRGKEGGDPGAVIYDAVERAAARNADLVLADTAGRLQTKTNLMEELRKIRRIADKPPGKVTEVLLVLDATTGQNGLSQAQQFRDAAELTGVVLTKLDGTAKGGIALAIQQEFGIPIKLVGLGEGQDDLVTFDPDEFVEALFAQ